MFPAVSFLITRLPELDDRRSWQVFEERYSPILKCYFMKRPGPTCFVHARSAHKKEGTRPIFGRLSLPCEPSGKPKGRVLHLREAMSHVGPSVRCGHKHERVFFLRRGPHPPQLHDPYRIRFVERS